MGTFLVQSQKHVAWERLTQTILTSQLIVLHCSKLINTFKKQKQHSLESKPHAQLINARAFPMNPTEVKLDLSVLHVVDPRMMTLFMYSLVFPSGRCSGHVLQG